jgi:hypothetical protein
MGQLVAGRSELLALVAKKRWVFCQKGKDGVGGFDVMYDASVMPPMS